MTLKSGSKVKTPYGNAVVIEVRPDHVVCQPITWRLAGDSIPTYYMNPKDVTALPPTAQECIDRSKVLKKEAMSFYTEKKFTEAKKAYFEALKALDKVSMEISDLERAEVFELNVTCHNNVALCSFQMKDGNDTYVFASNAHKLVEAIEKKATPGPSKVFESILTLGTIKSLDHMRKTWKRKSLYYMGQALVLEKNFDAALAYYAAGRTLIAEDPEYAKDTKKIDIEIEKARAEKVRFAKKEKAAYSNAFGGSSSKKSPKAAPSATTAAVVGETATSSTAPEAVESITTVEEVGGTTNDGEKAVKQVEAEEEEEEYAEGDESEDDESDAVTNWESSDWTAVGIGVLALAAGAAFVFGRKR